MSNTELSFEQWMNKIDKLLLRNFFMSIHDLPDMCFWDMFQDGITPKQVVEEIMSDMPSMFFA